MKISMLKSVDTLAYSLLLIGALNWGIVGFFDFNLVATICGRMTMITKCVYGLMGLAALYDLILLSSIFKRREAHLRHHPVQA